jgi:predicted DNA-binding transcriptional regulator AlpA
MTHHLVGMTEIAEMLGVSPQRAHQLSREYADFPDPEVEISAGRVWKRAAVERWIKAHPARKPGRPPSEGSRR